MTRPSARKSFFQTAKELQAVDILALGQAPETEPVDELKEEVAPVQGSRVATLQDNNLAQPQGSIDAGVQGSETASVQGNMVAEVQTNNPATTQPRNPARSQGSRGARKQGSKNARTQGNEVAGEQPRHKLPSIPAGFISQGAIFNEGRLLELKILALRQKRPIYDVLDEAVRDILEKYRGQ